MVGVVCGTGVVGANVRVFLWGPNCVCVVYPYFILPLSKFLVSAGMSKKTAAHHVLTKLVSFLPLIKSEREKTHLHACILKKKSLMVSIEISKKPFKPNNIQLERGGLEPFTSATVYLPTIFFPLLLLLLHGSRTESSVSAAVNFISYRVTRARNRLVRSRVQVFVATCSRHMLAGLSQQ